MAPSGNSSSQEVTTIGTWAGAIVGALNSYGIDGQAVCSEAGIDVRRITDPNYRIPVAVMTPLWRHSVTLSGDTAFGLRVAEHVSLTTFHALGFASFASRNFQEVAWRIMNNVSVVSEVARVRVEMKGEDIWFCVDVLEDGPEVSDEAIDAFLGAIVFLGRRVVGVELPLAAVHLKRPDPGQQQRYDDFFSAPVTFASERNALLAPLSAARQMMPGYNPDLVAANEKVPSQYQAARNQSLVAMVEARIAEVLPDEPQQSQVAEHLNMSVRKLQRQLAAENTSYQKVLDRYREKQAMALLKDRRVAIKEVAYQLGFANQSAFTRAFKRWTGLTPRAYLADG